MKTLAEDKSMTDKTDDRMIYERDAEILMTKAFEQVIGHMNFVSKELTREAIRLHSEHKSSKDITPQRKNELKRQAQILEGRAQGLDRIAIPILVSAAEMIMAEPTEDNKGEKGPSIILPDYLD